MQPGALALFEMSAGFEERRRLGHADGRQARLPPYGQDCAGERLGGGVHSPARGAEIVTAGSSWEESSGALEDSGGAVAVRARSSVRRMATKGRGRRGGSASGRTVGGELPFASGAVGGRARSGRLVLPGNGTAGAAVAPRSAKRAAAALLGAGGAVVTARRAGAFLAGAFSAGAFSPPSRPAPRPAAGGR